MIKQKISLLILKYLRLMAKLQLQKNKPVIIGVTGSAGKTTARNLITAAISKEYKTKVSYKANSESGLPLNILGLSLDNFSSRDWLKVLMQAPLQLLTYWPDYKVYVAEMAIDSPDSPKNMGYLLTIFQPNIGVFLNSKPMHSFNFDKLCQVQDKKGRSKELAKIIAHEKGKMIVGLPKEGTAILNTDDENVWMFSKKTKAKVVGFGSDKTAGLKILKYKLSLSGTKFSFQYQKKKFDVSFEGQLLPKTFAYSLAASILCGLSLKIKIDEIVKNIEENFISPSGRSNLLSGINDSYIIDSSYNSSAEPLISLLQLAKKVSKKKTYAILGDIRELGLETQHEHEKVVPYIKEICDEAVLVGPQMKKYVLPKLKNSKKTKAKWFATAGEAGKYLKTKLNKDDVVLVKGSQNELFLEMAVEKLLANPNDSKKLCRRGKFWDKQRTKWLARNR